MSEINVINQITVEEEIPELMDWVPNEDQVYMEFKEDYVEAHYSKLGLNKDNKLGTFIVKKKHYKDRMEEICNVVNYFSSYFDPNKQLFHSTMSVKFIIDQKPKMSIDAFRKIIKRVMLTDEFVQNVKNMTKHLYKIDIDTDLEGRYKSTPKITNEQARLIVSISFAIRCVLPLAIHFSDTNMNFITKKDYIKPFDRIIMTIIKVFEKDDISVFSSLCRFVQYRIDRAWNADIGICLKKKQLYGITKETYLEEVIHEVIIVKGLYKLEYNRSVVSFIDGIIFRYHTNFKIENFKAKPVEIDENETTDDDSEHLSHAEAIDMSVYRVDESNEIINEVNTNKVLKRIRKKFNIHISDDELGFYRDNIKISVVTKLFLESFYNKFFHDANAVLNVSRDTTIELIVYMKKYLQLRGLVLIPQICTARVKGKYKENTIKNSKFNEKIKTSDAWNKIIQEKFTYIPELNQKDDFIMKKFSSFVNSAFEFVDYDGPNDGMLYEDLDTNLMIKEFSLFLTII